MLIRRSFYLQLCFFLLFAIQVNAGIKEVCVYVYTGVKQNGPSDLFNLSLYARSLVMSSIHELMKKSSSSKEPAPFRNKLQERWRQAASTQEVRESLYAEIVRAYVREIERNLKEKSNYPNENSVWLRTWIGSLGRFATQDVQNDLIKSIERLSSPEGSSFKREMTLLLFHIASFAEVGFSDAAVKFFDEMPLAEKVGLVDSPEMASLSTEAKLNMSQWRPFVKAESMKQRLKPFLDEYFSTGNVTSLVNWISVPAPSGNDISLTGPVGYYDQRSMIAALALEHAFQPGSLHPLHTVLHRLIQHRVELAFQFSDRVGPNSSQRRPPRFLEPAGFALLAIFSRMNQEYIRNNRHVPQASEFSLLFTTMTEEGSDFITTEVVERKSKSIQMFLEGDLTIDVLAGVSDKLSDALKPRRNWRSPQRRP